MVRSKASVPRAVPAAINVRGARHNTTPALPVGDGRFRLLHELGLSERVECDADAVGYRRCTWEQTVTAEIIRRLRELDMPLNDIRDVVDATDVETRNRVIADHLGRLESHLARTQAAACALRDLLNCGPQA